MVLVPDRTSIRVTEEVVSDVGYTDPPGVYSVQFVAYLDGESMNGEGIEMSRSGQTPDEAIKTLFEAMHDAGISL